jgi:peptide deformylase
MSDMQIVFAPSLTLRKKSVRVSDDEFGEELNTYMNDMLKKMYELNGAGLAGIQIGDARRLLVADGGEGSILMVNPEILERSEDTVSFKEGCLSLPGFQLEAERNKSISVKYSDPLGEAKQEEFSGVNAVIIQHEIDHLDGVTLLEKVSSLKKNIYVRKINKLKRKIQNRIKQNNQVYY